MGETPRLLLSSGRDLPEGGNVVKFKAISPTLVTGINHDYFHVSCLLLIIPDYSSGFLSVLHNS